MIRDFKMSKKNHICFSINKKYLSYVFGCVRAILRYAKEPNNICFVFLLNNDINEDDIKKLTREVLTDGGLTPLFIYPENEYELHFNLNKGDNVIQAFDQTIFYRLFLPELLNADTCLYLDVDIAVCGDITELFTIDLGNSYIMGVTDRLWLEKDFCDQMKKRGIPFGYYVCTGIFMMNLKKFRKDGMTKKMKEFGESRFHKYLDQDIINYCCHGNALLMNKRFHVFPDDKIEDIEFFRSHIPETKDIFTNDALTNPIIVHFIGQKKPWNNLNVTYGDLWKKNMFLQ